MKNILSLKEFLNEEIGISESEFIFLNEGKQPLWPLTSNYSNIIQRKFGDITAKEGEKQKTKLEKAVSLAIGHPVKMESGNLFRVVTTLAKGANRNKSFLFSDVDNGVYYSEWTMANGKRLWALSMVKGGYSLHENWKEQYIETDEFDPKWIYRKFVDKTTGSVTYSTAKKDGSMLHLSKSDKLLNPNYTHGEMWVDLTPGSKSYNAIKTKVFGDV
jgi:hypothetical protein